MKRFLTAIVAVALLAAGSLSAQPGGPAEKGKMHHRMFADLNLSDAQQQQIKALHEEMQALRGKHMESVKAVRENIKKELLKPDASQNDLYGYAAELGELHKQMMKDRSDHLLKVKKVLTPDQFAKLVEREEHMGPDKGCGAPEGGKCPNNGKGCMHKEAAKCPGAGAGAEPPPHQPGGCPHQGSPVHDVH